MVVHRKRESELNQAVSCPYCVLYCVLRENEKKKHGLLSNLPLPISWEFSTTGANGAGIDMKPLDSGCLFSAKYTFHAL